MGIFNWGSAALVLTDALRTYGLRQRPLPLRS